jgi:hypothetical protein
MKAITLAACALLTGAAAAQEPGGGSAPLCPDLGVVRHEPLSVTYTGLQACDWGLVEFRFGGVTVTWEDPVCPLFILVEPNWTEIGEKHGARVMAVKLSEAMKFNFACDEETENCTQVSVDRIGIYAYHIDAPCGPPPEITPPLR